MSKRTKFRLVGLFVILVNAFVQCLLVIPSPIWGVQDLEFILLTLISALVYLCFLVVVVALKTAPGSVSGPLEAVRAFRPRLARFVLWLVGYSLLTSVLMFVYLWPGLLFMAITPMIVLAAADGTSRPISANFHSIKHHFWGYVWRILLSGLLCLIAWLAAGLFMFLLVGAPAAFAGWLIIGVFIWILTNLWLRFLRRTPPTVPDRAPETSSSEVAATAR